MDFFNKKEEVLDLQLTEYGRYLLSQGLWHPHYYAFFDDDVLYDSQAGSAGSGSAEVQNNAERRIQFDTPSLKVQPYTIGAQARVDRWNNQVSNLALPTADNSVAYVDAFNLTQPFEGATYLLASRPLGTSNLKKTYAPAWNMGIVTPQSSSKQTAFIGMNLTASNVSLTSSHFGVIVQDIPQVDITINYNTFFAITSTTGELPTPRYVPLTAEFNGAGVRLFVEDDYLVVDLLEENTDYLKENFDIEVFRVEGLPSTTPSDGNVLEQLLFMDEEFYYVPQADIDVGYYLNVLVDNELPPQIADNLGITQKTVRGTTARLALSRDLYGGAGDGGAAGGGTDPAEGCE